MKPFALFLHALPCRVTRSLTPVAVPALALTLALALLPSPALAHKGSDAYLDVQQTSANAGAGASAPTHSFTLSLAVAIRDLDLLVPIDANADASVTWGEIKAATPQVLAVLQQTVGISTSTSSSDGAPSGTRTSEATGAAGAAGATGATGAECTLAWQADGLERRSDGAYFRAVAQALCPAAPGLRLRYELLKAQDATHRLLVKGQLGGQDFLSTVSPQQGSLVLGNPGVGGNTTSSAGNVNTGNASGWASLRDYFSLGMHHLLEGYDHLAFLLALVLPLQLSLRRRRNGVARSGRSGHGGQPGAADSWGAVDSWGDNWLALLRTVTAFTVGHSITLVLATFGFTQASPLWVEPVIALSIAVTAMLNLYPVRWIRYDVLALLFGLIHGYGFAGLLQEAAAPSGLLPWALTGFNLGVEAGQLLAVLGWVLISQMLVGHRWYHSVVVRGGSMLLIVLAAAWFWERVS